MDLNTAPKISVIVPVYNVEKYLPDCIDSLLSQTYSNLEIILVNDGSTDHGGAVCDTYARKDPRVKVIHKENGGVCTARNAAFQAVTGDYFTFVDSDDRLEPAAYEKVMAAIRNSKADLCFFGWKRIDEATGHINHSFQGKDGIGTAEDAVRQSLIFKGYAGHIWNKVFASAQWQTNGSIEIPEMDPKFAVGEDCEWLVRVLPKYTKAVFLAEELYNYLVRSNSAINISQFTDARLTEVYAREKIAEEVASKWPGLESAARAKAYARLIDNGMLAYKIRDKKAAAVIRAYLKQNRKSYFGFSEISLKQKLKAVMAEILIHFV